MKITNRRAFFDYELTDTFEAVKLGKADLTASFVRIVGSEIYLINATIFPYQPGQVEGYDPQRSRKLLLHKKQIISLKSKAEGSNYTLVPVSLYIKHGLIKVEVALGKGKKKYEKKEAKKKADLERDLERELGV